MSIEFLPVFMWLTEDESVSKFARVLKPRDVFKWPVKRDGINYCKIIRIREYIEKSGISPYHKWGWDTFQSNPNITSMDLGKYKYPCEENGGFSLNGDFYVCVELQDGTIGFASVNSFRKKDRINPLEEMRKISLSSRTYIKDISFLEEAAFEAVKI